MGRGANNQAVVQGAGGRVLYPGEGGALIVRATVGCRRKKRRVFRGAVSEAAAMLLIERRTALRSVRTIELSAAGAVCGCRAVTADANTSALLVQGSAGRAGVRGFCVSGRRKFPCQCLCSREQHALAQRGGARALVARRRPDHSGTERLVSGTERLVDDHTQGAVVDLLLWGEPRIRGL
jgi:hypothetical protein